MNERNYQEKFDFDDIMDKSYISSSNNSICQNLMKTFNEENNFCKFILFIFI